MSLASLTSVPESGAFDNDHWWILYADEGGAAASALMISIIDDPLKYDTPQGMGVFTGIGAKWPVVVFDAVYGLTITCSFLMVPYDGGASTYNTPMEVLGQLRALRALSTPLYLLSPFGDNHRFVFGSGSGSSSSGAGTSSGQYAESFYSPMPGGGNGPDDLPVIQVDVTIIEVAPLSDGIP
jgi:hypothetical protein